MVAPKQADTKFCVRGEVDRCGRVLHGIADRCARGGALSRMTATGAQSAWAVRTARNMRNRIANALGWSSDSVAGGSVATLGIFASVLWCVFLSEKSSEDPKRASCLKRQLSRSTF
eukprot:51930-Prymnesium_polylepis.1